MKTLLFTIEYPPFAGGVANYYGNLKEHWPEEDKNKLLVLNNNENKLIKKWLWPKWLPAFYHLHKIIRQQKIDHVLVGHILPLGIVALLLSRVMDFKFSIILHGMDFAFATRGGRKKIISKKILEKAEHVLCSNSYVASLAGDFLGADSLSKIAVINPGINDKPLVDDSMVKSIKEKYKLNDKIVLLTLGRLVKRKGVDKVLEALPAALKVCPNIIYAVIGEGEDEIYLKEKAKGLENVIFIKALKLEKWNWFSVCDIFIMPSRNIDGDFEGFGIVYLEANLMAKPVIAGDSGGVRDAVCDGVSGILVDGENTSKIADSIIRLAKDKDLRERLGKQGRDRAIRDFNWKKQIYKIYNIICGNI